MLSLLCFIAAAICFFLGFINARWPNPPNGPLNWISGGLMFVTIGLWLVPHL